MRGKKLSKKQVNDIQELRKKGTSLNKISELLSIPKSTIFVYLKDIIVPEDVLKQSLSIGGSTKVKMLKEKEALVYAKNMLSSLSLKEKVLVLVSLYWAEGSKQDFGLSNTDPNLIAVYLQTLREVFGVKDSELRISIRIYEDLDKEKCLQFWSKIVNIPKEKFVNVNILPGKKKGKLQYGMCRVRVSKGEKLLKRVKAMYSILAEKIVPIA